jgi:hypothetical protein
VQKRILDDLLAVLEAKSHKVDVKSLAELAKN